MSKKPINHCILGSASCQQKQWLTAKLFLRQATVGMLWDKIFTFSIYAVYRDTEHLLQKLE